MRLLLDTHIWLWSLRGPARLEGKTAHIPGDISSAAFFLAAALLVPESNLVIQNVGLNPTRTAILDVLASRVATFTC